MMNNKTPFARKLRRHSTKAENLLWLYLKNRQLNGVKFRRQQPIGPFVVDFVSFDVKVIVELDGGQHVDRSDYDNRRTNWLEKQGFRVIRLTPPIKGGEPMR